MNRIFYHCLFVQNSKYEIPLCNIRDILWILFNNVQYDLNILKKDYKEMIDKFRTKSNFRKEL